MFKFFSHVKNQSRQAQSGRSYASLSEGAAFAFAQNASLGNGFDEQMSATAALEESSRPALNVATIDTLDRNFATTSTKR